MTTAQIFAQRLKELRQEKPLTQTQLAEALNYKSYTIITHWESGNIVPDIENLIVLANFFKVSIDYLVGREK